MKLDNSCCCVCSKVHSSIVIRERDSDNTTIISKLQSVVLEVEWEESLTICPQCLENLSRVIEFRNLCVQSSVLRKQKKEEANFSDNEDNSNSELNDLESDSDEEKEDDKIEDVPISCKACNIKFEECDLLYEHNRKVHDNLRPYVCIYCDKLFRRRAELARHEEIHLNERTYKCEFCNTAYNTKPTLQKHNLIKHTDRSQWKHECKQCDSKFPTRNQYENHLKTHLDVFICFHCEKQFNRKAILVRHIRLIHNKQKFTKQCSDCDNVYINQTLLDDHRRKIHSIGDTELNRRDKVHQCDKCGKSYTLEKVMKSHFLTCDGVKRHSKISFPEDCSKNMCEKCCRFYTTEKILKAHIKVCNGIRAKNKVISNYGNAYEIYCKMCKAIFPDNEAKVNHLLHEHNIDIQSENLCAICYKKYDTKEEFEAHLDNEHKNEVDTEIMKKEKRGKYAERCYSCEVCNQIFGFVKEVIEHCVTQHSMDSKSVKPFLCDKCDTRFTSSANMIQHKQYHDGNRTHICSFCGKSYITKSDLTVHEYTHFNKRNYKCEICDKAFNTNKNLRSHKLVVHTDSTLWKYACKMCAKRFPLKSGYDQHLRRHAGDKRFPCHICQKPFISGSELRKHMTFHSNVRAFKCDHCDKEYKEKRVFEIHLTKVHGIGNAKIPVRVKKFACHICPNTFFDRQKLARHLCTHSGLKPFPCNLCDKKFTDKSYLKHHLKVAHNIYEPLE